MLGWNEDIKKRLGACGQNVFIGQNVMFARPEKVFLGDNVRIDPFALITGGLVASGFNQISSHCIVNGRNTVHLGKWVGFGYRTTVLTGSEDFTGEHGPSNDWFGHNVSTEADVYFEKYSNALSNALVMPGTVVPEGAIVGAYTMMSPKTFMLPYCIYVGNPPKMLKRRNEENIKKFAKQWEEEWLSAQKKNS